MKTCTYWIALTVLAFGCDSDSPSQADAGASGSGDDANGGAPVGGGASGGGGMTNAGGARQDAAGPDIEGLQMCCILGSICHPVDDLTEAAGDCHDVGHQNDPAECRVQYTSCRQTCEDLAADAGGFGDGGLAEPVEHACSEEAVLESLEEHHQEEEHHEEADGG